jgi:hypothetical protein
LVVASSCSLALGAFMNNDLLSIIDLSQKLGPAHLGSLRHPD